MQDYRKLIVWQKAHAIAVNIKEVTESVARDRSGFVSQARRASLSVSSNIAEGCSRATNRDFAKFLQVSIASASELEYQLEYARDTTILTRRDAEALRLRVVEVRRMLYGLLKRVRDSHDDRNERRDKSG